MKSIKKIIFLLLLTTCMTASCRDENESPVNDNTKLIQGRWNSYEFGREQTGFASEVTANLTIAYESGITFLSDGTFKTRYHNRSNGTWTESDIAIGTYELKDKTITLLFSRGTKDEYKLDIQLIKLDEKYLWFKHSVFVEMEYHLERVD